SAFHRLIYFANWHIDLSHDDLEMPDQGFHLSVHILLGWQVIFRNIGMINFRFGSFEFLNLMICLLDDTQTLPHFLSANKPAVIVIAGSADRNIKLKILVT